MTTATVHLPMYIYFHRRHHDTPLCDGSSYMAPCIDIDDTAARFVYEYHHLQHGVALWAVALGLYHHFLLYAQR